MLLLRSKTHTTLVTGSAWKPVVCTYCGCQFVYQIERQTSGQAKSSWLGLRDYEASNKARESAYHTLDKELRNEIEAISCPDCGMYQENMVHKLKKDAWLDTVSIGILYGIIEGIIFLIALCLIPYAPESLKFPLLVTLLFALMGLWIWAVIRKVIRAFRLDPNANAKKRLGRTYSKKYPVLRRVEFEKLQGQYRQ